MVPILRTSVVVLRMPFGAALFYCLLVTNVVAAAVPATNTEEASERLEEISVTAQRREESISRVPISLTAISQKTIDDLHLQSFSDLEGVVPGLVIATPTVFNPNLSDLAIRGVFAGGNAPTVQVYVDETPIAIHALGTSGISASPSPDIFDLDRIEVLRGPQGTLFGSSTMGGAIRFLTPQPSLNSASGYSNAEVSNTHGGSNSYALGMAYGAPIVEGLAGFRMSALYHTEGGYIDQENPYTGALIGTNINASKSYLFRPALTIAPLEGLSFTLSAFVQHTDIANPAAYWRTLLPNPKPNGNYATGSTQQQPTIDDMSVSALTVKYELPAVLIQSNTSHLYRKYFNVIDMTHSDSYFLAGNDFLPGSSSFPAFFWNDTDWTNALQQEFRFSSRDTPGARLHWVGGLYYRQATQTVSQVLPGTLNPITLAAYGQTSDQFFGLPNYVDSTGQIDNGFTFFRNIDKEKAVFGEISFDITSQLKATVGLRVSQDTVSSTQFIAGPLDGSAANYNVLPTASESPITPRYALAYQINDQNMLYASAAKGYRAGGDQVVTWLTFPGCQPSLKALGGIKPPVSFKSDTLWTYELGTKNTLFDRKLQVQASVYYVKWSNIQTQLQVPSCAEAFTTNFGQAISRGFDLQLAALATEHLTVGATAGYTDAYYPKDEISSVANGVINLLAQKGEKLPNIPPWSAAVNAVYRRSLPQWSGANGYFRVDYRFISAIPALDPALSNYDPMIGTHQDQSYGVMNMRLGIVHGGLDVSLFVNNVTRANPVVGYQHIPPGDPLIQASQIRPLTMGFTVLHHIR